MLFWNLDSLGHISITAATHSYFLGHYSFGMYESWRKTKKISFCNSFSMSDSQWSREGVLDEMGWNSPSIFFFLLLHLQFLLSTSLLDMLCSNPSHMDSNRYEQSRIQNRIQKTWSWTWNAGNSCLWQPPHSACLVKKNPPASVPHQEGEAILSQIISLTSCELPVSPLCVGRSNRLAAVPY